MVDHSYPMVNHLTYRPPTTDHSINHAPTDSCPAYHLSRRTTALAIESTRSPSFHGRGSFYCTIFKQFLSFFYPRPPVYPFSSLFWLSLFSAPPFSLSLQNEAQFKKKASRKPFSMNPPTNAEKFISPDPKSSKTMSTSRSKWYIHALYGRF